MRTAAERAENRGFADKQNEPYFDTNFLFETINEYLGVYKHILTHLGHYFKSCPV
jgi:hypothetical protein